MKQIQITSPSFENGGNIPSRFTCDSRDMSPELSWSEVPDNTKSFALICDDPDAPAGTWVHWILYNIPEDERKLSENFMVNKYGKGKIKAGMNDFKKLDYGGPCPPSGVHRYFFRIYALDTVLNIDEGIKKRDLLECMDGHVIGKGELVGKYKRNV